MNRQKVIYFAALAILVAVAAASGGYWWGARNVPHAQAQAQAQGQAQPEKSGAPTARKVRFYRNPMGLDDTSPTPKKDPMGMDYIPVYDDEVGGAANMTATTGTGAGAGSGAGSGSDSKGGLQISADKVQKLGVRTEIAALRAIDKTVRATGRIETDERRTYTIAPKFEGYIEKLHVNATGQAVTKGQPLFEVYSAELVSAQREYSIASQGVQAMAEASPAAKASMQQLADASLQRLRNWDIPEEQLRQLSNGSEASAAAAATSPAARKTLTFRSPVTGIVTEKKAIQGMRFMPGDALYQVTDLSRVWVMADVAEQDIAAMRVGAGARVSIDAYPGKPFNASIATVYPTLNSDTRTVQIRLELANPQGLLKPGMFGQVELSTGNRAKVLTVPASALIDSGTRQIVLVQNGAATDGRFEVRAVRVGARDQNYVEIIEGVREGDAVVTSANFLIDAESNLKAAIAGFGASSSGEGATGKGKGKGTGTGTGKVQSQ